MMNLKNPKTAVESLSSQVSVGPLIVAFAWLKRKVGKSFVVMVEALAYLESVIRNPSDTGSISRMRRSRTSAILNQERQLSRLLRRARSSSIPTPTDTTTEHKLSSESIGLAKRAPSE